MQSPCTEPSSVDEKLCPGCCSECIFGRNKKRARSREEEKLDHCLGVGRLCCKSAWEVGAGGRDLIIRAVKRGSDCQGPTAAVSTEHSNACSAAHPWLLALWQWNHCVWRWER